ncbi:MAG: hypothetical protein U9O20_04795 [Patescibacteria group bacterium]|nr:hypothetical protein [Patescibacteria group bacterium]
MHEELKEWLGITKADGLIYLTYILAIGGFFIGNIFLVSLLYVVAIISGIYSIKYGSPKNNEISKFTNAIKKYIYHVCLFIAIVIMIARYIILF